MTKNEKLFNMNRTHHMHLLVSFIQREMRLRILIDII